MSEPTPEDAVWQMQERIDKLERRCARLEALARFGLRVLQEHREHLGDLDGGWLQDTAEEAGLLVKVTVTESCGEYCRCADYDSFPQECLRYSDAVLSEIRAEKGEG